LQVLRRWKAFGEAGGSVRVSTVDADNDGRLDVALGTGPGGGALKVWDYQTSVLLEKEPFGAGHAGGLFVGGAGYPGAGGASFLLSSGVAVSIGDAQVGEGDSGTTEAEFTV